MDIPDVTIRQILEELDWNEIPPRVANRLVKATIGAWNEALDGHRKGRYTDSEFLQKAFTISMMPVEFLASNRDDMSEARMEAWFEIKKQALLKQAGLLS